MKFSIIVPAYNVADYIADCLDSILAQDFKDWEAIIIDDGSTDATPSLLKKYHDPRFKIIRQKNAGLSAARNAGIRQASGDYLLLLDGDDFLTQNALTHINEGLREAPDLLRFQIQDFYSKNKITPCREAPFSTMPGPQAFLKLAKHHYVENAWAYAYRRDFFLKNHFQYAEGRIAEDFGLTPLIIAKAATVKSISSICYNYRQRPGSIMHDDAKVRRRLDDSFAQMQNIIPEIAAVPHTDPIIHYLLVSSLTFAARFDYAIFSEKYRQIKTAGHLRHLKASNLKAYPRTALIKHFPHIFYRLAHSKML